MFKMLRARLHAEIFVEPHASIQISKVQFFSKFEVAFHRKK